MSEGDSTGAKRIRVSDAQSQDSVAESSLVPQPMPSLDSDLTEDRALSLLKQAELGAALIERIARNTGVLKYRKVKLALVEHPRTPRHVSLPLIRQLYTFDLMQVALTPAVAADLKRAAEEALCNRLDALSAGERLSLARRASGRVAGELLFDSDARIMRAALENGRMTEPLVIKALMHPAAPAHYVEAVCHHAQWSIRREVRIALLRNERTPMAKAIEFAHSLPAALLREILHNSRLPQSIKGYLLKDLAQRGNARG
jgi:hypothetical protein